MSPTDVEQLTVWWLYTWESPACCHMTLSTTRLLTFMMKFMHT